MPTNLIPQLFDFSSSFRKFYTLISSLLVHTIYFEFSLAAEYKNASFHNNITHPCFLSAGTKHKKYAEINEL